MINSTYQWIIDFFRKYPEQKTLLDVGSLDVNGNIREVVPKYVKYTGVDMRPGANVDVVVNAHNLLTKFAPESFDVVTCFDTFEHDDMFWISWDQIKQVTKKGGFILLGLPSRFCPLHDHPNDYWRFMPGSVDYFYRDFTDVLRSVVHVEDYGQKFENEIYIWGRKP